MKSRIKKLLRHILYWDSPVQGAFFGLTMAGIGVWLLLSLFHFLWTLGIFVWTWLPWWPNRRIAPSVMAYWGAAAILLIYSLFLVLRFYTLFCRRRFQVWIWLVPIPFFIALAVGVVVAGLRGSLLVCCVMFCWIFPLLLPEIGWRLRLGQALCWSLGLLICDVVLNNLGVLLNILELFNPFQEQPGFLQSFYLTIQKFLHLRGVGWVWFLAAGLLLLLLGYLLTARLWTRAAGLPYRQIFGRGVTILWLLLGVHYLFQLCLAWQGVKEVNQAVTALEQHFNRPLTAQALGELYYNGEQPDPDFWQREKTLRENIAPFPDECWALSVLPDEVPPEAMLQLRQHLQSIEASLSQWEQLFSGSIPPPALSYQRGHLLAILRPHLEPIRNFGSQSRRRVRLALADGDVNAALAACERQNNANNALLRESSEVGALIWIACTEFWLDSLEMLLESRALSDEQLNALTSQLKAAEKQVPVMHERTIYSEAICMLDVFVVITEMACQLDVFAIMTETGNKAADNGLCWRDFRYFVPQLWWYAALDKAYMARAFMVSDFSEMPDRQDVGRRSLYLSNILLPALQKNGNRFHGLTARLRAMQALITAELHRRRHGAWPKQLENLPEDPFTGEPLRYHHGNCVLFVDVAKWDEKSNYWKVDTQQRSAAAVQVWSVGPDKVDNSGPQAPTQPDGRRPDDIRAILRLKPPQL